MLFYFLKFNFIDLLSNLLVLVIFLILLIYLKFIQIKIKISQMCVLIAALKKRWHILANVGLVL